MENKPNQTQKICSGCAQRLAPSLFGVRHQSADGLNAKCRACVAERNRTKYWIDSDVREKSKRKSIDSKRKRFADDPAYKRAFRLWGRAQSKSKAPPWVKITDFLPICAEVIAAGPDYELDHIIPLKGKLVSGLHVPGNVRVVLKTVNQKKSNHYAVI